MASGDTWIDPIGRCDRATVVSVMQRESLRFKTPPRPNLSSPMSLHSGGILLVAMEDRLDRQSDRATLMGQDEQHGHGNEKGVQILTDDGDFSLLEPASKGFPPRPFDRPLPCFGCGVGWFSFLLGFAFPPFWYYATVLYFGNYHHKDPRERAGLAASAIAALISTVAILISLLAVFFPRTFQRH